MSCGAAAGAMASPRSASASARARPRCSNAAPLTNGRADVDHALVLDRHERGAEAHDHVLGLREELVGCVLGVVAARNLDGDLVHRSGVDARLLQLMQQTIPVR